MAVTGLLAKKFSAAASLSSTDATRCYVNIDYSPLNALKDALTNGGHGKQKGLAPPVMEQFVNSSRTAVPELPIQSILETVLPAGTQAVRCICRAKIIEVLAGNGWYYNCCPTCARALRDLHGKFYCLSCNEETPSLAQRIVVRVEDKTGSTTVTLFNKEAEQLVGIPLRKILAEQAEEEQIPPVVSNIIGKICAFQLKITPYNIIQGCEEYTVTRVSEELREGSQPNMLPTSVGDANLTRTNAAKKQKLA